jgi:hypothetical protein
MSELKLNDPFIIGYNDHGYMFGVARVGERWVGFALAALSNGRDGMFLLPGISSDHRLGLADRERAIRMVGAVASAPEHGYGGIERWFVGEELRGKPDDFRCVECGEVGCSGEHF